VRGVRSISKLSVQDASGYRGLIRQNRPNLKTRRGMGSPATRRKRDLVLDGFDDGPTIQAGLLSTDTAAARTIG